jgi:hypothetical protein
MTTPHSDLLKLLLGGRTPEEVVADVSQRLAHDAAQGTSYGPDIVHEKHFTHGGMRPVPVAYRHLPQARR